MMVTDISPIASVSALALSLFTLWFTVFRRGSVRSTHPSFIALRYDFVDKKLPQAKIFFRSLIFSTGKRGQVVESLFLRVSEGAREAEFSFWGHGDKDLIRGSGLFVSETGVVTNHHFNPIDSETIFMFSGGSYSLELMAKLVGKTSLVPLWKVALEMPVDVFKPPIDREKAVYYNWSAEKKCYGVSIENRSNSI
jgi:hypothetical protein